MSQGSSLPYRLRPNKAVDRELFLAMLDRLTPRLPLRKYHYIGLGGPFLEDFRLVHARLGITRMTSVEDEEETHKRQKFNRPIRSIECVHSTLEEYLDDEYLKDPVIIWFDYTKPRNVREQIERFARSIGEVPLGSILRITLNANPTSLGEPDSNELSVDLEEPPIPEDAKLPTIHEWRLKRFRDRMGPLFPAGHPASEMTHKQFGHTILQVLKLAVERTAMSHTQRNVAWGLATHYADGQPMVTATLVVCSATDSSKPPVMDLLNEWEFASTPDTPHRLDLPDLSSLERLTMESNLPSSPLAYRLPKSDMGVDPIATFRKFYRFYPHFSRIQL